MEEEARRREEERITYVSDPDVGEPAEEPEESREVEREKVLVTD